MPKRKREDTEQDVDRIKNQAIRIKASRLKARFDQGVTQLTQALKLARGFDRQKMTRRINQAGSDKSKLERLKAEVEVLNRLQEPKVARRYLLKQCVRTKRIAEAEGFIALFGGSEKVLAGMKKDGTVEAVEGNVLARLMKSGPVNDVVPGVIKGVREVLAVDKEKSVNPGLGSVESHGTNGVTPISRPEHGDQEDDFTGFSDDAADGKSQVPLPTNENEDMAMEENDPSEHSDNDLLEAYSNRLAASSDSESDYDEPTSIQGQNHDRLDDMELTPDEDLSDQDGTALSISENDQLSHKPPTENPPSISSTSFLPSLMHGGYYSGSDTSSNADPTDLSYDPDKSFAAMTQPPRKNRRGQQERRAIAEKKFGSKAKHLIKANGAEGVHSARQGLINGAAGRDQGWDTRRGAIVSRERKTRDANGEGRPLNRYERRHGVAKVRPRSGFSGSGRGAFGGATGRSTGANSMALTGARPIATAEKKAAKSTGTKERLHPSWEAARKRKIESATIGASSFAGKKTTFD